MMLQKSPPKKKFRYRNIISHPDDFLKNRFLPLKKRFLILVIFGFFERYIMEPDVPKVFQIWRFGSETWVLYSQRLQPEEKYRTNNFSL